MEVRMKAAVKRVAEGRGKGLGRDEQRESGGQKDEVMEGEGVTSLVSRQTYVHDCLYGVRNWLFVVVVPRACRDFL